MFTLMRCPDKLPSLIESPSKVSRPLDICQDFCIGSMSKPKLLIALISVANLVSLCSVRRFIVAMRTFFIYKPSSLSLL